MSIAVCAVIKPSRLLRMALLAHAAACLAAALTLAMGQRDGFFLAGALAAACLLGGVLAWRSAMAGKTTHQIDISGPGEIRLTVQQHMGSSPQRSSLMRLLPGSTVWPHCLLLLLSDTNGGAASVLILLPDSMEGEQFRMLGVAIRAIAGRDHSFFWTNKIF